MVIHYEIKYDVVGNRFLAFRAMERFGVFSRTKKFLPPEYAKNLSSWLQKSMKLRAPRDTGYLRRHIKVKAKLVMGIITIDTRPVTYAFYQDKGFRPHSVAPWRPTGFQDTIGESFKKKYGFLPMGAIRVSKYKPFIDPALQAARRSIMPKMLRTALTKELTKIWRKG